MKSDLFYIWLPKLASQSVLLWDGMKIKMERMVKGHIKITPLPQTIAVHEAPQNDSV